MDARALDRNALLDLVIGQRGHTPLGLLLRALRALLPPRGLLVASSLAHSPFDLLARDLAPLRHLRFLPPFNDAEIDLGHPELRTDATLDTSVVLGDADLDVDATSVPACFGPVRTGAPRLQKRRRVDTLFGSALSDARRVHGLVICESAERALQILQGSEVVMRRDRPIVVARLDDARPSTALLDLLTLHRYVGFDQELWARDDSDRPSPGTDHHGEWILALPCEGAYRRMADAVLGDAGDVSTAPAWNSALGRHLWLEARSGGVRFEHHAAPTELTLPIDSEVARWGFYEPEGDAGAGWSWIGPRPRAGLVLPPLAARLDLICLRAVGTASARNVEEMQVAVDGEPAHVRRHWQGTTGLFEITPSSRRTRWLPMHRLEIVCPETLRPNAHDERRVALSLASVTLSARRS